MTPADRPRFTAVLGPTNTGKTHLAVERMLGHASGMIGFPLRLLARENYERIVAAKGRDRVALVTGEERIVPPGARWFVCTVESMPVERSVAFVAVDEIQLCADPERGHIFTHRLLHVRGTEETMVMGAETIRPLIRKLVPDAVFVSRPRLSELRYAGPRKLTRLPARSAVVAFSAADVYAIAELIRRQRGGTAVVLGALSPRTRNAQMAMYQAGEVDYLVATDAIGMGLNMDVDHVAFARLTKFDGRSPRRLFATEIAQIAGRAGRHTREGTFGTTDEAGPLDPETVERVENHRFDALKTLRWRNADLDFRAPLPLLRSLEAQPPSPVLRRTGDADDHRSLATLIRDDSLASLARGPERVRLLWEVCQIPDFRKVLSEAHTRLQAQIFRQLAAPGGSGRLDTDWVARQVARLDRTEGDIDTLVGRIAHVRTWTYIAHRADWVGDPAHWQARTRAIEDALSDALHDRLTQRFVDRRTTLLRRARLGREDAPLAAVDAGGRVMLDGEPVGSVRGLSFVPDDTQDREEARTIESLVRRAVEEAVERRARQIESAEDTAFALEMPPPAGMRGRPAITWQGETIATLGRGTDPLRPAVRLPGTTPLPAPLRRTVQQRLSRWIAAHLDHGLDALARLRDDPPEGAARGIAFQLVERLGVVPRAALETPVEGLSAADRRALGRAGIRIGRDHVFLPALLRPRPLALRALLLAVAGGTAPPDLPPPAAVSIPAPPAGTRPTLDALGFVTAGPFAIRLDRLEALHAAAAARLRDGPLAADPALARLIGASPSALPGILSALGYRARTDAEGRITYARAKPPRSSRGQRRAVADPDSPFAALAALRG